MEKKNKKQERQLLFNKIAIFFAIMFLAWFNLSRADINGLNVFQDKDQDGISDKEEYSYGTDPEKKDTDGDGYSDKVEIESGYDPLKPAPGDKLIADKETQVLGDNDVNLTEEFFEEIKNEEFGEAAILNELITTGDVTEEELSELYSESGGEGDLSEIINGLADENLTKEIEVEISEDDIKILSKPEGEEDEVRQVEKEQIEGYMSSILYILAVNRPFELDDISDLPSKISDYIFQIEGDIEGGNLKEIQEYKNTIKETFEQIKKLEAPYVLVEQHLSILNIYQIFYNEIDEMKLLSDDDPLTLLVYAGKIEGLFFELELVQQEIQEVLDEYEIDSFDLSSVADNF